MGNMPPPLFCVLDDAGGLVTAGIVFAVFAGILGICTICCAPLPSQNTIPDKTKDRSQKTEDKPTVTDVAGAAVVFSLFL
jgi:hypothetical protein